MLIVCSKHHCLSGCKGTWNIRVSKKQVLEIIKSEAKLHEEYTKFFEEKYTTGYLKQDKVYELPNERFLLTKFLFKYSSIKI